MIVKSSLIFALLAVCSVKFASAQNQHNTTGGPQPPQKQLQCYVCNSGSIYQGDSCLSESASLKGHIRDCIDTEEKKYTRCRTIHQTVEDETRIIRSCATAGTNDGEGCIDRVGTHKVKLTYCECHNDASSDKPCNTASELRVFSVIPHVIASIVIGVFVAYREF